jgi:hypothetical protein
MSISSRTSREGSGIQYMRIVKLANARVQMECVFDDGVSRKSDCGELLARGDW